MIKQALSIPGRSRDFPLFQQIQTGSEVQPTSYAIVLEILFPGGQRPEYETNHSHTPSAVVPKVCFADPKISATSSQGIRGHNSVFATFKLDVLLKIIAEIL
jgi:hypothetical protein